MRAAAPVAGAIPTFDEPRADAQGRAGLRSVASLFGRSLRLAWGAAPGQLWFCLGLQVTAAVTTLLQLLLGRAVFSAVIGEEATDRFADVVPELLGLGLVTAISAATASLLGERQRLVAALVERRIGDRILDAVATVPLAAFEDPAFHDRLRRARLNAVERSWQVTVAILAFLSAAATLIPLGLVLVRIEPLVLPAALLAYAPVHVVTTRNSRHSYDFSYRMTTTDRERSYLAALISSPAAAKELRLFGSTDWLRRRHDELSDRRLHELGIVTRRRSRRTLLASLWTTGITVGGIALLVAMAVNRDLSPADAGVAAVAVFQAGLRVRSLGSSAGTLHECSLFLNDVTEFLARPVEPAAAPVGSRPLPDHFDRLRVEDLSFTYPGTTTPVLHDVSLEFGRAEVVAIVGANGSGKTTLAKLLTGLYEPTGGRVLWDDVDLATCDPMDRRRRVSAAFQDFVKYELSAAHNIGLGRPDRMDDLDAVRRAAALAGVDRLIEGLPDGYDTRLSRAFEDGADLSGGEWQRIALARAFLRDAPFLVLDEPTAALDPHAERALFDTITELQQGRSVLLISHRFSSVRSADRIYVLDAGRVIESGTHDALMAAGGRYAEMFTLQVAAYLDAPDASPAP